MRKIDKKFISLLPQSTKPVKSCFSKGSASYLAQWTPDEFYRCLPAINGARTWLSRKSGAAKPGKWTLLRIQKRGNNENKQHNLFRCAKMIGSNARCSHDRCDNSRKEQHSWQRIIAPPIFKRAPFPGLASRLLSQQQLWEPQASIFSTKEK